MVNLIRRKKRSDAQTSVDFLIGVSIFAISLLFVLQVASTSVVNVAPESQTQDAVAERAGTIIAENEEVLGSLDNYTDIQNELGVPSDRYAVNVTVRNTDGDCPSTLSPCTTGSEAIPPDTTTSGIAGERRVIDLDGETSVVEIYVWEDRTVIDGEEVS